LLVRQAHCLLALSRPTGTDVRTPWTGRRANGRRRRHVSSQCMDPCPRARIEAARLEVRPNGRHAIGAAHRGPIPVTAAFLTTAGLAAKDGVRDPKSPDPSAAAFRE